MGLSQKAHDRIVQYMGGVIAEENAADESNLADAMAALGENVGARVTAIKQYLGRALGEKGASAIDQAIGQDPDAFRAIEILVQKASGAQLSAGAGGGGVGITRADIEAEQYKTFPDGHKLAGQRMYDHDKQHRAKVDGMWKQLYPGEDHQEVG